MDTEDVQLDREIKPHVMPGPPTGLPNNRQPRPGSSLPVRPPVGVRKRFLVLS